MGVPITIVYYGPFLAGRHTSLAHAFDRHPLYRDRIRAELEVDGAVHVLHVQITRYRSFLGPAPYAELAVDDHYLPEREALKGELASLKEASAIVFVAAAGRSEANDASLAQLPIDLHEAGRDPDAIPVLFQLNQQDLVREGLAPPFDRARFTWPTCRFAETTAAIGAGVRDALETAVRMALEARASRAG